HALPSTAGPVRTPRTAECDMPGSHWPLLPLTVEELEIVRGSASIGPMTFRADAGEIVAIVGPTGIGKTTVLRALLGLEPIMRGAVRYGRVDVTPAPVGPTTRPFAWVPQEHAIVTGTLGDNVELGACNGADARAALALVGGDGLAGREHEVVHASGPELS